MTRSALERTALSVPITSSARRLKVSTRVTWVLTTGRSASPQGTAEVAELPHALVAEIERAGAR
jgi:hypothetical protein